ncbi:hypothetical protein SUDANB105_00802 [Streptomyces sp. enrichment culture]|uniref:TIM barrel protein n=1 Tax=Streptomyces sp. enrichment culture TaxID=1795815 RepID=UPI003F57887B
MSTVLSIPFLASRAEQYDPRWTEDGLGTEASLFDRADLEDEATWRQVWRTVGRIARDDRPPSFTFHFPVNDCDWIGDPWVRARLDETIERAGELGLDGIVLHSNRWRTVAEWQRRDLAAERALLAERVANLRERLTGAGPWIGLENMPLTGNDGTDLDPLLLVPADYTDLVGGNVGITWDFCHYSYTVEMTRRIAAGSLEPRSWYPDVGLPSFDDFEELGPALRHFHFSAFSGFADASRGRVCAEGVLPWQADVPEPVYVSALRSMAAMPHVKAITLEIAERDYTQRENVFAVARWCRRVIEEGPSDAIR